MWYFIIDIHRNVKKGIWCIKLKYVLKALKYIAIVILVILALIIATVFVQTLVSPNKIPSIFGYKPFIVLTGSMESELYEGDLAIVKDVDVKTLQKNEIIAFRENEKYVVTHRIVDVIEKDGAKAFITKGDNNNIQDEGSVSLDNIEGLYVYKISGFGNVLLVMQSPITLCITLIIIVAAGSIWIMHGKNKLSKEEREELERLRQEKSQNN